MRRCAVAVLLALLVPGCAGSDAGGSGEAGGTVTVLAAASLSEAFTALGERFEGEHPGTRVRLSFAASSELATQATQGAPADVFAAAAPEPMEGVVAAGAVRGEPTVFARNRLQLVVPAGNPGGVRGLADLSRPELDVALCAPDVPCGAAARQVFAAAGLTAAPDTLEADAKATLTKVALGEVDAALVYRTDVLAAGSAVQGLPTPEATGVVNDYPVAVLAAAPNPAAARAFVALVLSARGRSVLADAGFELP